MLVRPIAAFYASCTPEPFDDLQQVGLMGLMAPVGLMALVKMHFRVIYFSHQFMFVCGPCILVFIIIFFK